MANYGIYDHSHCVPGEPCKAGQPIEEMDLTTELSYSVILETHRNAIDRCVDSIMQLRLVVETMSEMLGISDQIRAIVELSDAAIKDVRAETTEDES